MLSTNRPLHQAPVCTDRHSDGCACTPVQLAPLAHGMDVYSSTSMVQWLAPMIPLLELFCNFAVVRVL